jgi:hypothetical protein
MGEMRNGYKFLVGKSEGKNHLGELGADVRIILERILAKDGGNMWSGCIWPR